MIKISCFEDGKIKAINEAKKDCWINMINPTEKEVLNISEKYNIDLDDLKAALDSDESSRLSIEDEYSLVIVDVPTTEERNGKNRFVTIPLSFIICNDAIITVCLEKTDVLDFYNNKKTMNLDPKMKTRFLLTALLNNAQLYLKNLKVINKQSEDIEKLLHQSVENSYLLDMMELGKSLLYFSTSLKGNIIVLDKILKAKTIKKYDEDEDLLEDVTVETKQASEMSEIYSGILNGNMDAYASIISNNMNVVQKFIAVATIVIEIPNLIFGAYGMNLAINGMPLATSQYAFIIIVSISIIASVIVFQYFNHKKMY